MDRTVTSVAIINSDKSIK